jgi:hypothetical protein
MTAHEPAEPLQPRIVPRRDQLTGLEPFEISGELAAVGVALRRIARHRLRHDRGEIARDVGRAGAQRRWRTVGDPVKHRLGRAAIVRRRSAEELVENRAERVDIGAAIHSLAARLFGRHVGGRADDLTERGPRGVGLERPRGR